MIEYIFKTWVFVWVKENYQLIGSCITAIVFMIFIGQKILGKDTFDKDERINAQEKVRIYFALFCGVITAGVMTAFLISYFN